MGDKTCDLYNALIEKITSWAENSKDVKTIFAVGSRARTDYPADEYSDLDLVMLVTNPEDYISSAQWLKNIGNYWVTFIENTAVGGGKERRVLFENALDVDFAIFSEKEFEKIIGEDEVRSVLKRGFRILYDRDGRLTYALSQVSTHKQYCLPPKEGEYLNLVNDFWYHTVWSAKKLQRSEIWIAKSCVDCYMKEKLLRMIEWHTGAMNSWNYDTWHAGRFLDIWAEPKVKDNLPKVFSHYDKDDIGQALWATMDLFRLLAVEVAEKMDFKYPEDADNATTDWVKESLDNFTEFSDIRKFNQAVICNYRGNENGKIV